MKADRIYETWKESKKDIVVSKGFCDRVMRKVCGYEQSKPAPLLDIGEFLDKMYSHRLTRAGLIVAAALAGLARMAFALWTFLAV